MAKVITENFRVQTTNELFKSFAQTNGDLADNFLADLTNYVDASGIDFEGGERTDLLNFSHDSVYDNAEEISPDSSYYVFASSIDKEQGIDNTQFEKREFLRRVIFGNKVTNEDIRFMFSINNWESGTSYDAFDDRRNIEDLNFYVTVLDGDLNEAEYKVYKCIRNGDNGPSIYQPSTTDPDSDNETLLEDGYVWRYLFSVPAGEYITYSAPNNLPYVANQDVIDAAKEDISDILIEESPTDIFQNYDLGSVEIKSVVVDDAESNTWKIELECNSSPKQETGSYTNMYFAPTGQTELFKIINSETPSNDSSGSSENRILFVYVSYEGNLNNLLGGDSGNVSGSARIHAQVAVTKSSGEPCIAYGKITDGGLEDIEFTSKGSEYQYATARVVMPPALEDRASEIVLRVIVSPRGGHGSDPISELYMSKLSVITNFLTSSLTETPDSNTYTKVGLIKNPVFNDASTPVTFDNRIKVTVTGDARSEVTVAGSYVTQTHSDETVSARIHEVEYDLINAVTYLYLVDYIGDHASSFITTEDVIIKPTLNSELSDTLSINNVTTGKYTNYSGDLLHFVDFDPITRSTERKEKVKFVFDF